MRGDGILISVQLCRVPRGNTHVGVARTKASRAGTQSALVALTLVAFVFFSSGSARGSQEAQARTIRVISIATDVEMVVDKAPKNKLSVGDVFRTNSVLRNAVPQFGRAKGAVVGRDSGVFTMVSEGTFKLKGTAVLPSGSLRVEGLVGGGRLVPVVGGTGAFAGARGTCRVRDESNTRSRNTYTLRLP